MVGWFGDLVAAMEFWSAAARGEIFLVADRGAWFVCASGEIDNGDKGFYPVGMRVSGYASIATGVSHYLHLAIRALLSSHVLVHLAAS